MPLFDSDYYRDLIGDVSEGWRDLIGEPDYAGNEEKTGSYLDLIPQFGGWIDSPVLKQAAMPKNFSVGQMFNNLIQGKPLWPGQGEAKPKASPRAAAVSRPAVPAPTATPTPVPVAPSIPAAVVGPGPAPADVTRWGPTVQKYAQAKGVPTDIALAIMEIESGGNPNAQGALTEWGKAQGLMQVMPFHWPKGTPESVMRAPKENIEKGLELLKRGFERFGNWESAIAAYFGAVDNEGNPTADTEVNGVSGEEYLRRFKAAHSHYAAPAEVE